jgi:phosphatidylserine/phosphatidylglycerophosphate/cardiolipin synthase-like enzyme
MTDIKSVEIDLPLTMALREPPRGQVELVADGDHFAKVLLQGVLRSKVSVEIATADLKAVLIPDGSPSRKGRGRRGGAASIIEHLARLAERGVELRVLHSGVPSGPVLSTLRNKRGQLPRGLTFRRCPRVHMKAVIIDGSSMYLGSANLTGAGLGAKAEHRRNFELGVWTTSVELIEAVSQRFNAVWEGEHCDGCGQRDVCPVPLEEPRL